MLKMLLFVFLFSSRLCFSQGTIESTGSSISPGDAQAMLDQNNKVRNDVHVPPLTWNSEIAAYAQHWADSLTTVYNCKLNHRGNVGKNYMGYGENIYIHMGALMEPFKPVTGSVQWYSEIPQFKYGKLTSKNWYKTGHYTQMVWKNTTQMGAGMATCPDGSIIVVANYNPPGNYMGEYPY